MFSAIGTIISVMLKADNDSEVHYMTSSCSFSNDRSIKEIKTPDLLSTAIPLCPDNTE